MACHVLFVRGGSMRRIGRTWLRRFTVVVAGSAMLATSLAACGLFDSEPKKTLNAFLAGWHTRQWDKIKFVAASGAEIPASQVATELQGLAGELADKPIKL